MTFTEERFQNQAPTTDRVLHSGSKKLRAEDALYNFSRSLERFHQAIEMGQKLKADGFEEAFCDLMEKRFEFTYEMSWKALKRYLDALGISAANPRACFKEAYAQQIITEQDIWLDMIESRNLSSHVYSEFQIRPILDKIDSYELAFKKLKQSLEEGLTAI